MSTIIPGLSETQSAGVLMLIILWLGILSRIVLRFAKSNQHNLSKLRVYAFWPKGSGPQESPSLVPAGGPTPVRNASAAKQLGQE